MRRTWTDFTAMTPRLANLFRRWPLKTVDHRKPDLCTLFRCMSQQSRALLLGYADTELQDTLKTGIFHYADMAFPETGKWETPKVVERVTVNVTYVTELFSTVEGRRLVSSSNDLLSFLEFEERYQMSVREAIEQGAAHQSHQIERARNMAGPPHPAFYDVVFTDQQERVARKAVLAYTEEGARIYASRTLRRTLRSIVTVVATPAFFLGGAYTRKGTTHV